VVALRYVMYFGFLYMTACLHIMARNRRRKKAYTQKLFNRGNMRLIPQHIGLLKLIHHGAKSDIYNSLVTIVILIFNV